MSDDKPVIVAPLVEGKPKYTKNDSVFVKAGLVPRGSDRGLDEKNVEYVPPDVKVADDGSNIIKTETRANGPIIVYLENAVEDVVKKYELVLTHLFTAKSHEEAQKKRDDFVKNSKLPDGFDANGVEVFARSQEGEGSRSPIKFTSTSSTAPASVGPVVAPDPSDKPPELKPVNTPAK